MNNARLERLRGLSIVLYYSGKQAKKDKNLLWDKQRVYCINLDDMGANGVCVCVRWTWHESSQQLHSVQRYTKTQLNTRKVLGTTNIGRHRLRAIIRRQPLRAFFYFRLKRFLFALPVSPARRMWPSAKHQRDPQKKCAQSATPYLQVVCLFCQINWGGISVDRTTHASGTSSEWRTRIRRRSSGLAVIGRK